tara:strand:- start:232 stop:408 length:177 start_codon:yes stop_codon:yes gene_type:complete
MRCGERINKAKEDWSTIGQAVKRDKIIGGVLCERCGRAFIEWMKEGGFEYGPNWHEEE